MFQIAMADLLTRGVYKIGFCESGKFIKSDPAEKSTDRRKNVKQSLDLGTKYEKLVRCGEAHINHGWVNRKIT